ncbi:hypothetical protein SAMN05216339_10882 [Nitrosomonas eutropha]|uniref:Uncharacterized protein n=1 Tax=Nitrosomonas eutropha TaxID=916 RepID=A0A1I7IFM3_9PROT|nr:hypothetical protein SAMN05216339_10882 [Nitrosomonas eutropha]
MVAPQNSYRNGAGACLTIDQVSVRGSKHPLVRLLSHARLALPASNIDTLHLQAMDKVVVADMRLVSIIHEKSA